VAEHRHHTRVITFFAPGPLAPEYTLDEAAAHHASVRRLKVGDEVSITEGVGFRRTGRIAEQSKKALTVTIETIEQIPQPPPIHLFVPVADRDRMLWLAEKATELQVTTWTPVMYRRSKSVSPRGEGDAFNKKIMARMISALEQSHGSWLPEICPMSEVTHMRTIDRLPAFVLDRGGEPFGGQRGINAGMSFAVGPEGGFEPDEIEFLRSTEWAVASLGNTTLRFETAAVAALAIARDKLEREHGR
jgi:16S rRNA (uracil1498-N3)-methyltransferase